MDLRPSLHTIRVWRNDTLGINFTLDISGVPINLGSSTVRMQIRPDYGSNTLSLSLTEGNGITVTGTNNDTIEVKKLITLAAGSYVYDLEVQSSDGTVKTYVNGDFIVSEDATK